MESKVDGWSFSRHALGRALDMALEPDEIRSTLTDPDRVMICSGYPDCELRTNRRIALAVHPESKRVITVLWYRARGEFRFTRELEDDLKRIRNR